MVDVQADYKSELTRIHRSYGQYRRFFPGAPSFEELTGYKKPQKITEGSIKRLQDVEHRWRGTWEIERRRQTRKPPKPPKPKPPKEWYGPLPNEDRLIINNFLKQIDNGTNHVIDTADPNISRFGASLSVKGAKRLNEAIHELIDKAVGRHGMHKVAQGLSKFTAEHGNDIERYAYSVIDTDKGGFNTNTYWWKYTAEGMKGRFRFKKFTQDLCDAVGMPNYAQVIIASIGR